MDRSRELSELKQLPLSLIAADHGWSINRRKSTRSSVLMEKDSEKIIISKQGPHYVYCSVHGGPTSSGTVIDFIQHEVERGASLGRVRQLLRPYLGGSVLADIKQKHAGRYAPDIRPSKLDVAGVQARFARLAPITGHHPYLCDTRGVPAEVLQDARLLGRLRTCPRFGSVAFPHYGSVDGSPNGERVLVGYEIKGGKGNVSLFSKGGKKSMFITGGKRSDNALALCESGVDSLSYLALAKNPHLRVASLAGRMNNEQPAMVQSAIQRLAPGSQVIAAVDNDAAGDEMVQKLHDCFKQAGRGDLRFHEHRPKERGADWNQVLLERSRAHQQTVHLAPQLGVGD